MTTTATATTTIQLASPNGPVTRTILGAPLRDALPSEIPIIDIASLVDASSTLPARQAVAARIRDAATNTGFFYIVNHGVPLDITDASGQAALDFFRQDLDVKLRARAVTQGLPNGYRPPEFSRINPAEGVDVREAFQFRYDPRWDPLVPDADAIPQAVREGLLYEDDAFAGTAASQPGFGAAVTAHFRAGMELARALTRAFALSLDLPEDALDKKSEYPGCAMAVNYYPPISGGATAEKKPKDDDDDDQDAAARVSIGSHTDFQLFTILWQDDVGGLQVLNRDGQWIRAAPIRGSLVVNIADYMQRITNDRYMSTVHRAQNGSGRERVSIAFFWGFGFHESCGVLDTCVAAGETAKYEEINCRDWVRKRLEDMHKLKNGV